MKTWKTGVMVAKKDFYQEGENLVNRRLLPFMLHLAAHLLAFHAIAFLLLLSCSCIHGLHLDRNSGATPFSVKEFVSRQSPAVLAASAYCQWRHSDSFHRISFATVTSCSSCVCLLLLALRSRFARYISLDSVTVVLTVSVHCRSVRFRIFVSEIPPITCRFDS